MIYIHYYFADFAKRNNIDIFNSAQTTSYFKQKLKNYQGKYKDIRTGMVSGAKNEQEALSLIDAIEQDAVLSNQRSDFFKANYQDIGNAKGIRSAAAAGETIAQEVQIFVDELRKIINTIVNSLNVNLEELKSNIIQQYCEKRGVIPGTSAFSQAVLQDFLTHEGIKKLNINAGGTGQRALDSSLRNIILLAESLPEYGTSGGSTLGGESYSTKFSNGKTKNGSETLDIIQRKLQGLLNNVQGIGAEIAWAKAEEVGERKVEEEIVKANAKVVGGKVIPDGKLFANQQEKNDIHVSKPDVQVDVVGTKVIITYGVSVKQYKFNKKAGVGTVSLVSNTSLLNALEKYGKQNLNSIYNLAAGHASKKEGYSAQSLNEMWSNLVKQVTIANFLDALVGLGDLSVLYLVVNGKVIPVSNILARITENDITGRFVSQQAINRNAFVRMNQWIQSTEMPKDNKLALQRSAQAESAIYGRLSQAKLDISLKNLFNFI